MCIVEEYNNKFLSYSPRMFRLDRIEGIFLYLNKQRFDSPLLGKTVGMSL